jgi:hypothetical protein
LENERKALKRSHAIEHEVARRLASWNKRRTEFNDWEKPHEVEQQIRVRLQYEAPYDITSKEGSKEWERMQAQARSWEKMLERWDLMREDVVKS